MAAETNSPGALHKDLTHRIVTVFFAVCNELGFGFPEFVYRRALVIALRAGGMQVQEDVALPVWFRGQRVATFRADVLVCASVLLEIRAAPELDDLHGQEVLTCLKASDVEVGLLLNFGRSGDFRRLIFENARKVRSGNSGEGPSPDPAGEVRIGCDSGEVQGQAVGAVPLGPLRYD